MPQCQAMVQCKNIIKDGQYCYCHKPVPPVRRNYCLIFALVLLTLLGIFIVFLAIVFTYIPVINK
jgi:hypothetical protein